MKSLIRGYVSPTAIPSREGLGVGTSLPDQSSCPAPPTDDGRRCFLLLARRANGKDAPT